MTSTSSAGVFDITAQAHNCRLRTLSSLPELSPLPEPLPVLEPTLVPRKEVGTLVLVGNKNRMVAVGDGVIVGVLVANGISEGVLEGGSATMVCVCAAFAVCTITVSTDPDPEEEGGATSTGVPQLNMTNPKISHKVVRRMVRVLITHPLWYLLTYSFNVLSNDIKSHVRITEASLEFEIDHIVPGLIWSLSIERANGENVTGFHFRQFDRAGRIDECVAGISQ